MADAQVDAVLAQGLGEQLEQVVTLLEHLEQLVEVAGALAREVVEQARGAAQMQALDVAGAERLEGRAHGGRGRRAPWRCRSGLSKVAGDAPRAELGADEALVEVDAGELGEPLVDGLARSGRRAS